MNRDRRRIIRLIAAGLASAAEFEGASESERDIARTSTLQKRVTETVRLDGSRADDAIFRYRMSDEKVNRYGDIVRQAGWDLSNYLRNPTITWGHKEDEPAIGKALSVAVVATPSGPETHIEVKLLPDTSPLARTVYMLAKEDAVKAVSPSFRVLDYRRPKTDEQRMALGLGKYGGEILKSELLDCTLCNIPAQPGALRLHVERGTISAGDADMLERYESPTERDVLRYMDDLTAEAALARQYAIEESVFKLGATLTARFDALAAQIGAIANKRGEEAATKAAPQYLAAADAALNDALAQLRSGRK